MLAWANFTNDSHNFNYNTLFLNKMVISIILHINFLPSRVVYYDLVTGAQGTRPIFTAISLEAEAIVLSCDSVALASMPLMRGNLSWIVATMSWCGWSPLSSSAWHCSWTLSKISAISTMRSCFSARSACRIASRSASVASRSARVLVGVIAVRGVAGIAPADSCCTVDPVVRSPMCKCSKRGKQ